MAAAYDGEQNRSGMLMVKPMLTRFGFVMLLPLVAILSIFPNLMIIPFGVDDPLMLRTLPFAIRLISVGSLITLVYTLLIDYLSAVEEEGKATLALIIQAVAQIAFALLLNPRFGMDSPWYATLIGANDDIPETEEDDDEFAPNVCIRSEFLGARRLMIVLGDSEEAEN